MTPTLTTEQIERLARKRAGRKIGWYIHAFVFIAVNTGLAILSTYTERHYAVASAFAWGLGLLVHGAVVFLFPQGGNFREKLIQQERERLQKHQDKW